MEKLITKKNYFSLCIKKKINLALVAARKNSKGVKNKNLLKMKNRTITNIAVEIALKSKKN